METIRVFFNPVAVIPTHAPAPAVLLGYTVNPRLATAVELVLPYQSEVKKLSKVFGDARSVLFTLSLTALSAHRQTLDGLVALRFVQGTLNALKSGGYK